MRAASSLLGKTGPEDRAAHAEPTGTTLRERKAAFRSHSHTCAFRSFPILHPPPRSPSTSAPLHILLALVPLESARTEGPTASCLLACLFFCFVVLSYCFVMQIFLRSGDSNIYFLKEKLLKGSKKLVVRVSSAPAFKGLSATYRVTSPASMSQQL